MNVNCILLRYGELSLKGKNKKDFEERLVRNIRQKLERFDGMKVSKHFGRLFIELGDHPADPIIEECKDIFGLVGFSPALRVQTDLTVIKEAALHLLQSQGDHVKTFKVGCKRADKRFPIGSQEMNQLVGGHLLSHTNSRYKVDVRNPDLFVHVEVRSMQDTYIYGNDISGLGGLPVGTSGRVLLLLSGGIDSPVAGYLALKRGVELHAIHFHSYPFTSERAKQKVMDLAQQLTRFGGEIRLYVVPFTEIQTEINKHCYESYTITIMRRFMLRIAEAVAKKNSALALVTGESLGQVASQTLESMTAINAVTNMPILRPVIGWDKTEIIDISKKIDTYETSILPYEDCCTIFTPKAPKTRPGVEVCERLETKLDIDQLVQEAVEGVEIVDFSPQKEEVSFF
ncbi:tRNA uracil 4-sulfurtransferase ThiI [Thermoactinomyces sp. DSM 45892]|uniref:tRNA uracil 4-sulfurtransferase ThiI n=1 Tax=Thermoactinomyces sp. DSM 45892 TaxID=1882753 RepID=UPI00089B8EEF|nr:tRNA uracil 4-sulfurtransferase ThiI [Thermoactinomyces sp. DSM 45892]SDY68581.1 thiamine biosynthesis protein ThiI [Thermoactinomyces sp. DSM 45892]